MARVLEPELKAATIVASYYYGSATQDVTWGFCLRILEQTSAKVIRDGVIYIYTEGFSIFYSRITLRLFVYDNNVSREFVWRSIDA